jgi:hypothetical protein
MILAIVIHKKLDAGRFEVPRATGPGEQHVLVSDMIFEVIHKGVAVTPRPSRRQFIEQAAQYSCGARSRSGRWAQSLNVLRERQARRGRRGGATGITISFGSTSVLTRKRLAPRETLTRQR